MARITAGVASSHVPLLGVAVDQGKTRDDYFGPIFAGYDWTKKWEEEQKPDVVILVYIDHATWCGAWIEGARYTPRPLTCLWCVVSRRRFG